MKQINLRFKVDLVDNEDKGLLFHAFFNDLVICMEFFAFSEAGTPDEKKEFLGKVRSFVDNFVRKAECTLTDAAISTLRQEVVATFDRVKSGGRL